MRSESQVPREGLKRKFSIHTDLYFSLLTPPRWLQGCLLVFLDILSYGNPPKRTLGGWPLCLPGVPLPMSDIPGWALLECSISWEASLSWAHEHLWLLHRGIPASRATRCRMRADAGFPHPRLPLRVWINGQSQTLKLTCTRCKVD